MLKLSATVILLTVLLFVGVTVFAAPGKCTSGQCTQPCRTAGCAHQPIKPKETLIPTSPAASTKPPRLVCSASEQRCGDRCVDVSRDLNNCGRCLNQCISGLVCSSGICTRPPSAR